MGRFKWYRKWLGGTWYYNRYIRDAGRVVFFCWEREEKNEGWAGYTLKIEEYGGR